MDHKTCTSSSIAAAGTDRAPNKPPHPQEAPLADQHPLHYFVATLAHLVLACSRAAALALATYTFALTAWRARRDPGDLAFVAGAYAALAVLLLCLRRIETLPPAAEDPSSTTPGAAATKRLRRRLHAAVWALTAALSCAFAYRVSLLLPPALVALVWCMTSFVVLLGFYLLVLADSEDQRYRAVDDLDCDAAAANDGEPLLKKTRPTDEMV